MTATCVCGHTQRIHGPRPGLDDAGPECRATRCDCPRYDDAREAERRTAHTELTDYLFALRRNGLLIPCLVGSNERRALWTSENETDQHRAAILCVPCRAVHECGRYGRVHEPAGVWGATTEHERRRDRKDHQ
ncbi:MAG: hypothetical protein BGO37_08530 [Cellulomonas sp. 73-92]|mgnify:CR=1 FL=1|uniref:WhiB family transcriptional regulator n=1 Tax=Cellulomonas sp. 73-92 TaxID=1895740 RepID=UPI00092A0256|nr:WhiB family transcriptional regulator [Cellulomonas sp. 73-92]OJV84452.1 MAG: hypothetical protein BGO37_08530 [Cellulomonas sp. 73-92]